MAEIHTLVVHYPDGKAPAYSADTDILGGRIHAIDLDGNRLRFEEAMLTLLEDIVYHCHHCGRLLTESQLAEAKRLINQATTVGGTPD